ncbi:MAG: Nramp family divalent metal transporter [Acidobacteriota bacterium]|nr:Nramp family divalent metal transporter [Acidobacteriota bacterium]
MPIKQPSQIPVGLETVSKIEEITFEPAVKKKRQRGMRLSIRGRSVVLRGLPQQPSGFLRWIFILGPGLIAASAGNDAGGIATYSSTGARFGYEMLWVMLIITVSLAIVQEMCARLGAATGRGLLDLIRERFGLGWSVLAISAIMIANSGLVISEFVGIGAASELFGISRYITVPLAAVVIWYLIVFGSYARVERIFLVLTLVFFAYPLAAYLANPDWSGIAKGLFVPKIQANPEFLTVMVGLIGTTITPYMQIFQQSSTVERGVVRRTYGDERIDAYAGSIFSNFMSITMIIATAATLHRAGQTEIESAADAAKALAPIAGEMAQAIFGFGLFGASMLAAAVLPLATAYAVSETFGFSKGVNLDFRRAPIFFRLFTALILLGAAVALIPNIPVIDLLFGVQVLNGAILPIILLFVLLLANDQFLMRDLKNSRVYNFLGWTTLIVITIAVLAMFGFQIWDLIKG